jgi:hypothetical protein
MRALEITIWICFVLTVPSVMTAMGIFPSYMGTCGSLDCQAQNFIYGMTNTTSLQNNVGNPSSGGPSLVDIATITITYVVFAVGWILYIFSIIIIAGPALASMFNVPQQLSIWLTIGVWLMWMLAIIQIKRGGLSLDGYR